MMNEIFGMRNEGRGPRPFGKKLPQQEPVQVDKLSRRLLRELKILGTYTDTFRSYDGCDEHSLMALCWDMGRRM